MVFDLYADRLIDRAPATSEDVWYATAGRSTAFAAAARAVGLTGAQFAEFRRALLDGDAVDVLLPKRVDRIAGRHAGRIYVVDDAAIAATAAGRPAGWRVRLHDGTVVYVAQACGNLALDRPASRAHGVPDRLVYVTPPPALPVGAAHGSESSAAPAAECRRLCIGPLIAAISALWQGLTPSDGGAAPQRCDAGPDREFVCRK